MLRWAVNLAALVLLAGAVGLGWWAVQRAEVERGLLEQARSEVRRFEQTVKLQAATGVVNNPEQVNPRGWPVRVDPAWFGRGVPANPLLAGHAWLEIAGPDEADLLHPPVRIATDPAVPAFWYNPALGIVRARVPVLVNDSATTAAYNRINGADLASIFQPERPSAVATRRPAPPAHPVTLGGP